MSIFAPCHFPLSPQSSSPGKCEDGQSAHVLESLLFSYLCFPPMVFEVIFSSLSLSSVKVWSSVKSPPVLKRANPLGPSPSKEVPWCLGRSLEFQFQQLLEMHLGWSLLQKLDRSGSKQRCLSSDPARRQEGGAQGEFLF